MTILSFLLSLLFPISVYAATPTPTKIATPSATASSEEVQKIREVVQQKVKEKLQQINTTSIDTTIPKSVFGTITAVDGKNITLSYQNNTNTVTIADSTAFYDLKKNKISYSAIKIGQEALALGYFNEQNILEAKRFLIIDLKLSQNANQVIIGKVVDISKSSPIIVVIPSKNNNTQYQIKLDSKTEIIDQGNKKYTQANLVSGQKIITIIKPDTKTTNTYYASKIIFTSAPVSATPTTASSSATKKR
jgi:hypothetical protein